MKSQITAQRSRAMNPSGEPDLKRALSLLPTFERAVREMSRRLSAAKVRHLLVGALGANAYRSRPRTTADIDFLVGDEAFESHPDGFVTMRVPVVEVDGIDVDQVPLTAALRTIEGALNRPRVSEGVPIAPVETIVVMKLIAGRHQDLADVEAIIDAVGAAVPERREMLERLFANVDGTR
jgi:hypothetical protein